MNPPCYNESKFVDWTERTDLYDGKINASRTRPRQGAQLHRTQSLVRGRLCRKGGRDSGFRIIAAGFPEGEKRCSLTVKNVA
jgi:hypothetical protein